MHDNMFDDMRHKLEKLAPIPDQEWEKFSEGFSIRTLQNGEAFVSAGDEARYIGYLHRGLTKVCYTSVEGDRLIRSFVNEGNFVGAYTSMLRGLKYSEVDICAIEPSYLVVFEYESFRCALKRNPTWQVIGRLIAEDLYLKAELRQFELMAMPARLRFEAFKRHHPDIAHRVMQKDIAAFLGITEVSMSRLKNG